jgi:hypothetical protein
MNPELLESDAAPFPRGRAPMIEDSTAGGVGPQSEHTGCETEQGIPRHTRLRQISEGPDLAETCCAMLNRRRAYSQDKGRAHLR